MADSAESSIQQRWGSSFTQDDQNARLDAVLWDGNRTQAARVLPYASPALQAVAQARIAIQSANGGSDAPNGSIQPSDDAAAMEAATRAANPGLFTTGAQRFLRGTTSAARPGGAAAERGNALRSRLSGRPRPHALPPEPQL
jgi:hypothetical protein